MQASPFVKLKQFAVKNAPAVLKIPVALVPPFLQIKVLSKLLNRLFAEAIANGDLDFMESRWVQIQVIDLDLVCHVSFCNEQLIVAAYCPSVDLKFSADLNELILLLGRKEDPDSLFFQRRLIIEGDTEMGLEVKNLIDGIDFDSWHVAFSGSLELFSSFVANHRLLHKKSST